MKVQQLSHISIPLSATNLKCRTDSDDAGILAIPAPDYATWGRFDIPAADLPLVLAQMRKDTKPKPFLSGANFGHPSLVESWWHPEQLRNPQEVSWAQPGFASNLLFGESDQEGVLTVYFFNHSM